jgi:hypothetical protein
VRNIRLGWKKLTVTNMLVYYTKELIKAVKIFMIQAPRKIIAFEQSVLCQDIQHTTLSVMTITIVAFDTTEGEGSGRLTPLY